MDERIVEVFDEILDVDLIDVVISNSTDAKKINKVKIRPIMLKQQLIFQVSEYCGTQVFHFNYKKQELIEKLQEYFTGLFRQVQIKTVTKNISILLSKKGTVTIKKKLVGKEIRRTADLSHNRKKTYILKEDRKVPFLIDLGIMTSEGKIVSSKYDKFKQINRYLEFIEDVVEYLPKDREINIIDFGCGKSYLTFAVYYYLQELKGFDVRITGLDLKEDVIEHCNQLSRQYGYEKLSFQMGDIAQYNEQDQVDVVITLHACDTATDLAMQKAVMWGAKVIMCVPCCQHEVNGMIESDLLQPILKYGLIKERISALITDGLRARMLEEMGYQVQVLEFIDMAHTPKNILIRAVKQGTVKNTKESKQDIQDVLDALHINPSLYQLLLENMDKK